MQNYSETDLNSLRDDVTSQIDYWEAVNITHLNEFQRAERAQVLTLAYDTRERIETEALRRRVAGLAALVHRLDQKRNMRQIL